MKRSLVLILSTILLNDLNNPTVYGKSSTKQPSSSDGSASSARPLPLRPRIQDIHTLAYPPITGQQCVSQGTWQEWTYDTNSGQIVLAQNNSCLTAASWPVGNSVALIVMPCNDSSINPLQQQFNFTSAPNNPSTNAISLTVRGDTSYCANLAGYGTTPGTQVWLYQCSESDCQENCAWYYNSSTATITNPLSSLCLDSNTGPPKPRTCDPDSPSSSLPFCDYTLDLDSRIDDFYNRLSTDEQIALFSIPIQPNAMNENLNFPSIYWDITDIAGLSPGRFSPQPNVTVFPCTTGQAASFDADLVTRISMATALEGRIVNQVNGRLTGYTTWQGVLADGGPLANTIHDPVWGRISETYGEDYYLSAAMGIVATRALQNRTVPDASGLDYLMISQVTRHFMGTHGSTQLPHDAEEYILPQYLEEHQMRVYEAFQRPEMGGAEGVMCAISAFANAGDVPPPRNNASAGIINYIPNCVNTYLLDQKLRTEWNSDCFIQSDCCDSIDAIVSHDYTTTLEDAVADAVNAGLSASYGNPSGITQALTAALNNSKISSSTYMNRIKRTLRTLFRVGVFDTNNPNNPYRGPFNESLLDGPDHRALAREAVARTLVLLENNNHVLPLASLPNRLAVIGPFSHCTNLDGGYGGHDSDNDPYTCNYGHSYSGFMSQVSTYYTATQDEIANDGNTATVQWVLGSRVQHPDGSYGLSNASQAAANADMVLLVLGTGTQIEVEGLDRSVLTLPSSQLDLVNAVVGSIGASTKLIVVLITAGTVDITIPRADALIYAPYPGEEAGHGLWDVLMGRIVPSGRMPLTTYRNGYMNIKPPLANFNMMSSVAGFPVGRTYRYFNDTDARQHTGFNESYLVYRFGYGLSYCTFLYSNVTAQVQADNSVTVQVYVASNTRSTGLSPNAPACREATQVYLTIPSVANLVTPIYSLAAFTVTELPAPGSPVTQLHFSIPADMLLTTFVNGTRSLNPGTYTLSVSGHLPDDTQGMRMSNVLSTTINLPWSGYDSKKN